MFTAKFGKNVHFFFFTWKNMYDIKRESRHACWVSKPSLSPTVCFFIKHFLSRFQIPRPHLFYSSCRTPKSPFVFPPIQTPLFTPFLVPQLDLSLSLSHTFLFFTQNHTHCIRSKRFNLFIHLSN